MPPFEPLLARIRGEYREMPGLRLTLAQACRLWHLDTPTGTAVIEQLVREAFLYRNSNGAYIALGTTVGPARQVKARLSERSALRRPA